MISLKKGNERFEKLIRVSVLANNPVKNRNKPYVKFR